MLTNSLPACTKSSYWEKGTIGSGRSLRNSFKRLGKACGSSTASSLISIASSEERERKFNYVQSNSDVEHTLYRVVTMITCGSRLPLSFYSSLLPLSYYSSLLPLSFYSSLLPFPSTLPPPPPLLLSPPPPPLLLSPPPLSFYSSLLPLPFFATHFHISKAPDKCLMLTTDIHWC